MLLLFALMVVIVGCSSKSNEKADAGEEGTPQKGGEVTLSSEKDAAGFDPINSTGYGFPLILPMYDTLIKYNSELEPEPGLAEAWDFPDDKTIVLTLRDGVTFHDGTPFNAEAVKFNIERVNSEDSRVLDLENIDSVEVVDENTVKLHLAQPDSSILLALSDFGGMMVSPTAVKESGEDFARNPVGAGPYKMVEHIPNGEIVFEAYEDYWQENQPNSDKMVIKIMPDENVRINALKSGEIDFADNISPVNIANLEKESSIVLKGRTSIAFRTIYVNAALEPTNNKAVRQAIYYGINKEALVQAINFGSGEPAYQLFPSEYWAADENIKSNFDEEKAKQILKNAGMEDVAITMIHVATPYDQRLADAIKSQLSNIGIQVKLEAMESLAATSKYFDQKEIPIVLSTWTGRPDPTMTIGNVISKEGYFNAGSYSTDEIEKLIFDSSTTYDQDERAELFGEISQKALLDEAIIIPLFFQERTSAMNQSLKGFEPNLLGKTIYSTIWKEQ